MDYVLFSSIQYLVQIFFSTLKIFFYLELSVAVTGVSMGMLITIGCDSESTFDGFLLVCSSTFLALD